MYLISGIEGLTVGEIMRRWPSTVRIFIDHGLLCVGCPIGGFHTLEEAAREHGLEPSELEAAIVSSIGAEEFQL